MTHWFRNVFWIQQDYVWFLAGMGWLIVAVLWWQGRRRDDEPQLPAWVLWSAGAGLVTAIVQILSLIIPVAIEPGKAPKLPFDLVLGFVLAAMAAGWWASGLRGQRGRGVLVGVVGAIAAFGAFWRYDKPDEGVTVLTIVFAGAAVWWLFAREAMAGAWRIALVLLSLATMVGTVGPLAAVIGITHRWNDLNPVGPWAALGQIVAVVAVLVARHRDVRAIVARDAEDIRTERWFHFGTAAWLVVGFGFAFAAGAKAKSDFEHNALGRVRAAAALMKQDGIAVLLDERLKVGEVRWVEASYNSKARIPDVRSQHIAAYGQPVTDELLRLAEAHPDVPFITIQTLREGWLVVAAIGRKEMPKADGRFGLMRRATLDDERDWESQQARVYGPVPTLGGEISLARVPLLDAEQQMLGWLTFSFTADQWIAAQAQPRSLAYVVVAFGLVIGRLFVTQRRRVRERDRAQAQAVSATKASNLKTTFLANVSHELRTPLQTITGYTDMMLPNATEKDRDRLLAVREHADLMVRLVNDLIDLSAAESGNFHLVERPVALADHVVRTVETLRPKAEAKGLGLAIEASPEIPTWITADPQRVRQVVLNLVGNAIKYTDHGHVDVALVLVGRDAATAELELRVTDTGPGIDPEDQAQLFAAFHRLDTTAEKEGTGLGLAIVAAVCHAMRGAVRVESDGLTGSRFIARWRLGLAAAPATVPSGNVPLRGRRVLVADDNLLVRDLFVAFLTECGALCATANDGLDAIRRLRSEEFDAVVLDLSMPRLDGLATVRQLRRDFADRRWRIVGVSAHANGSEHEEALAAGMDAFLGKPVVLQELAQALAPEIRWMPPSRSFDQMRSHFEQRFRADAVAQRDAVARAWERREWKEIHDTAHYLKNSADVVGDGELARACASLEAAARARDYDAGVEAWRTCRHALTRWITETSAN